MHLKPNIDIMEFLKKIPKCESDVYFETPDGDILVLSSALSQYIFCSIINQPELLQSGVIRLVKSTDKRLLSEFLCD